MDSFRRDPGETSERGAKRPRLPAVFEAVKAGRFDELSLTGEIVAQALTFLVWELEELKKQSRPDAPAAPTSPEPAPASPPPPKRRGYSVKAWENRDDLELEA